ncbi:MAG: beta-lactamase family protein, partial [Chitinophagaceae bacterium]|nr:beta-lactamase family protein [Chitinophagaceae bacterium]
MRKLMLGLLTLVIVSMGYTQTIDKEKLDQLFDRLLEKNKGMGSIVIAKEGRIVYERAFGYSLMDGPTKTPITSNTRFRISSITKTYTAVMILQLVEEGKLKLQDNLDRFFPEIPNANKITIEQILRHRSGIPELKVEPNWGRQSRTHDEVLAVIEKGQPNFEPDSKHEYSNTGYVILGYIIEKVEGKPYQDVLKERITSKLGLKNTYLGEGNTNTEKNESLSYRYLGEWKEAPELNLSVPAGAGAIMSTPGDMAKFIQALFDHKLVSKASLDKMMTMQDGEGMGMEPFT